MTQMKFSSGDKVMVNKRNMYYFSGKYVGKKGTITKVFAGSSIYPYVVVFGSGGQDMFRAVELDKIKE